VENESSKQVKISFEAGFSSKKELYVEANSTDNLSRSFGGYLSTVKLHMRNERGEKVLLT